MVSFNVDSSGPRQFQRLVNAFKMLVVVSEGFIEFHLVAEIIFTSCYSLLGSLGPAHHLIQDLHDPPLLAIDQQVLSVQNVLQFQLSLRMTFPCFEEHRLKHHFIPFAFVRSPRVLSNSPPPEDLLQFDDWK
jgi:hypothetical protein